MNFLGNFVHLAKDLGESAAFWEAQGMKYLAIGIMLIVMAAVSIGEALVCKQGEEGISKNPEAASKIRLTMIIGTSLVETCAIYTLVLAILLIFVV